MTCPRCFSRFDHSPRICPDCGVNLHQKVSGIVKTSAVLISAGDENTFYDSVQEVPENLRKQLIETTASQNSGTIVIADRAGKEQLTQILARRESIRQRSRQVSPPISDDEVNPAAVPAPLEITPRVIAPRPAWCSSIAWVAGGAILLAAAGVSVFFGLHW